MSAAPHFRRVVIHNYRSIVDADLKLGAITVILGQSDAGKSNVIRALRDWAHGARGDDFITAGCTATRVGVAVGGEHKVVWQKESKIGASGSAKYVLVRAGKRAIAFDKVATMVPEEVQEVTGVRPMLVDDVAVHPNFAEQADPWFLISNPPWAPGKVTKVIGAISGIDSLILANRDLANKRLNAQKDTKGARARSDRLLEQSERYRGLDAFEAALARADAAEEALVASRERLQRAEALSRSAKARQDRLARAKALVVAGKAATELADRLDFEAAARRLTLAAELAERVRGVGEQRAEAKARRERAAADLERLAAELERSADGGATCPLCLGAQHDDCREAVRAQARAARA